jgi:hypothetical protein
LWFARGSTQILAPEPRWLVVSLPRVFRWFEQAIREHGAGGLGMAAPNIGRLDF